MLTNEEKNRIWEEELFRWEVRQKIEEDKSREPQKQQVWTFLNSRFGLWLLATVVVGLLSWGYTKWEAGRAKRESFRTIIVHLDTEIEARLHFINEQLCKGSVQRQEFCHIVDSFSKSRLAITYGVFEKFNNRSIRSLILELRGLVSKEDKDTLARALKGIDEFLELRPKINPPEEIMDRKTLQHAGTILWTAFTREQWDFRY